MRNLTAAYREFTSKLNPEETAQLKTAQLAWIKFRDANCEFVADAIQRRLDTANDRCDVPR